MVIRQIRIGSMDNVHQYDDGDFPEAIETDQPIKAGTPVDPTDVIRLEDLGILVGNVISLGASTDNAIPRFHLATGKIIQNSLVLIDDVGKIFPLAASIGGVANYLNIDGSGVLTLLGTAKRELTLRPEIDYTNQIAHAKPTQVTVGVFKGFSFPIYAADDEELFFKHAIPGRWDGVSNIVFHTYVCLAAGEDVGDYFKFRFSWEHAPIESIVPATSHDVDVEQIVLVGRNSQYDLYELSFIIDYDIDGVGNEIKAHELLAGRLYRIDATNPDITGEVILLDWHSIYTVDKMFKAP